MSGPPFNYADVTFRVTVDGDGRKDRYVMRPINPATSVAWSPPVALDVQSPMFRATFSGGFTFSNSALILPYQFSYVAMVPPTNSTQAKTLKGVSGDVGLSLIPNEAVILAAPNPVPNTWAFIYSSASSSEPIDVYIW